MKNFEAYASVYDLIYADKNYLAEADYIATLIRQYAPQTESLLDLGCGTGRHAVCLAQQNFNVIGLDRSYHNLRWANQRRHQQGSQFRPPLFFAGNIADFSISREVDAAVSLFHVFSYLTETEQLVQALGNIRQHVKTGGLLLFDGWYGPAVINHKPLVRVKSVETDEVSLLRVSDPVWHVDRNAVDVHFKVMLTDKRTSVLTSFCETHSMRYFFQPEMEYYLKMSGFCLLQAREWMTEAALSEDSWNVLFIARAV